MDQAKASVKDFGVQAKDGMQTASSAADHAGDSFAAAGTKIAGSMNGATAAVAGFGTRIAQSVSQFASGVQQFAEHGERMNGIYTRLIQIFVGSEILRGMERWVAGASEMQNAFEQAANAAQNMGHAFDPSAMEAWVKKFALSAQGGGYAIDQMAMAVQRFAALGANGDQIKYLLASTATLAAATGETFNEAMDQMAGGAAGLERGLRRLGLATRDADGNLRDFGSMVDELNGRYLTAAEKRAASAAGEIGVLGNEFKLLGDDLALTLGPALERVLGLLQRVVQGFEALKPAIQEGIAFFATLALGLTALALVGQALSIIFEGLRVVFGLLLAPIKLLTGGFELLGAAMGLATWEVALIAAAIAGLIAIIVVACQYPDQFRVAFVNALQAIGNAITRFVAFVKDEFQGMGEVLAGAALAESGDVTGGSTLFTRGLGDMKGGVLSLGHDMGKAISDGTKAGLDAAQAAMSRFFAWTKMQLGNMTVARASLFGLGDPNPQRAAADHAGKAEKPVDLVKAGETAIDAVLERFIHRVDVAKAGLAEVQAKLQALRDARDPHVALTNEDVVKEQAIERAELEKTLVIRKAIVQQRDAELQAAKAEGALAKLVSATDKDHDSKLASIRKKQDDMVTKAASLNAEWMKLNGTIAKLGIEIKNAFDPLFKQELAVSLDKRRSETDAASFAIQLQQQLDRQQYDLRAARGPVDAKTAAAEDVRQAAFSDQLAKLAEKLAQDELNDTRKATAGMLYEESLTAMTAAQKKLSDATDKATKATTDLLVAKAKELALQQQTYPWTAALVSLIQKVGIPGLTASQRTDANGNPAGGLNFAFSLPTFLLGAIEQSKSFADIMSVVNQLMKMFAQIIDALRPVIDLFMQALAFVVNIFIDLYNLLARLLRLFGLHIQLLDRINANFNQLDQNTVPLIEITHALPTMNELAAGKLGSPLSMTPIGSSNLNNLNSTLQSPNLGGGLLSGIIELGALMLILHTTHLFHIGVHQAATVTTVTAIQTGSAQIVTAIEGLQTALISGGGGFGGFANVLGDGSTIFSGGIFGDGGGAGVADMAGASFGSWGGAAGGGGFLGGIGSMLGSHILGSLTLGTALGGVALLFGLSKMFGPHWKAGTFPDRDPATAGTYGQDLADLQGGPSGSNGVTYQMDTATTSATSGAGWLKAISSYITGGGQGLTSAQKTEFSGATMVTNLHDGILTLNNGFKAFWSSLVSDAQAAMQAIGGANGLGGGFAALIKAGTDVRQGLNDLMQPAAQAADALSRAGGGVRSMLSALSSPASGPAAATAGGDVNVSIATSFYGDVNGYNDVNAIGEDLGQSVMRTLRTSSLAINRVPLGV